MSEFKSNFCPSEQTPFLSQSAFLAKENNFYFGGKIKATEKIEGYNSSTCPIWHFYHQDHLGNTRVITDENGNILAEHKYFPYGEEITNQTQDTLSHRFTGHERDFESNLDYMMARYYSSFMGRFLSVDRFKGIKGLAQSLNRYSYVLNNPIIYNDPSGNMVPWFFAAPGGNIWDALIEEQVYGNILEEDEKKESDNKDDDKKKKEQEELLKEAGVEGAPPRMGTETQLGTEINKNLKEAGQYSAEMAEKMAFYMLPIERFLNIPVGQLLPASLKRAKNFPSYLENKTYAEILKLAKGKGKTAKDAKMVKKLIEGLKKYIEKESQKPR
jgi:RHS repeat-associated protein